MIRAWYATPITPTPLFPTAAMVPETCVPCPARRSGRRRRRRVPSPYVVHVSVPVVVHARSAVGLGLIGPRSRRCRGGCSRAPCRRRRPRRRRRRDIPGRRCADRAERPEVAVGLPPRAGGLEIRIIGERLRPRGVIRDRVLDARVGRVLEGHLRDVRLRGDLEHVGVDQVRDLGARSGTRSPRGEPGLGLVHRLEYLPPPIRERALARDGDRARRATRTRA